MVLKRQPQWQEHAMIARAVSNMKEAAWRRSGGVIARCRSATIFPNLHEVSFKSSTPRVASRCLDSSPRAHPVQVGLFSERSNIAPLQS